MSIHWNLSDAIAPDEAAVGVDVGGTKTLAIAYSAHGPVAEARVPTAPGLDGVLHSLASAVRRIRADISHLTLRSIGVGIPGIVDTASGTVSHGVNVGISGANVPLGPKASAELGLPVHVVNDATAATLGAAHAAGAARDAALISIGTGLAAGIILDGKPRLGYRDSAGEIGHIPYVKDGLPCRCGQRGCLELYASGRALDRMWPTPPGVKAGVDVFSHADRGDPHAVAARDEWVSAIAHAVTIIGLTFDVEAILIGGGVSDIGEPFERQLIARLQDQARSSAFLTYMGLAERIALVPPGLAVGALGACLAGLDAR
ncbi:MAG: ROK family protein [Ancrocorticia sp.]|jgi:predicted NBD/HSP70 family sugar kinase|nr:ROK family protein [Ancrocorticia sp.]MCI1933351.1 ROK family protein [Ancrocorticia sp.]MCI1962995.1 ROK family protein [Ancrocorticia sp.]MCI2001363.1 ROK family protein [Ancrocorticia sp.]MCI2012235.1 ROK family protein [Ancrocorticia sp.]